MSKRLPGSTNRWGCVPQGSECAQHEERMLCRHGCREAKRHVCVGPDAPRCMTPECGSVERQRGLCSTCIKILREEVQAGRTTMAAAEAAGKIHARKVPAKASQEAMTRRREWFRGC